jgi:hypothetical protein
MAAEKFGAVLDIDRFLGKSKDRLLLVGVELEGGWPELPDGAVRPERDGSVSLEATLIAAKKVKYVGEIPLPPESTKEFSATMRKYYPAAVNRTCGMHVHMSTKTPFLYQKLMVNKPYSYPATVVEYIRRWAKAEGLPSAHPLWDRLSGKCEYCQHVFQAAEQVKTATKDFDHHRPGHRYTVVSYHWSRYQTVECRLLPMMETPDQGIRAVQQVIDITNAWLAANSDREPSRKIAVLDDGRDGVIVERQSWI